MSSEEKPFQPSLLDEADLEALRDIAAAAQDSAATVETLRTFAASRAEEAGRADPIRHGRAAVAASLLADLREQGWLLAFRGTGMTITPPQAKQIAGESFDEAKDRHRQNLLTGSNRQLATPGVQDFLRSMERSRIHDGRAVSIASLIDDGTELADRIAALEDAEPEERIAGLGRLIRPVVEVCDADSRCRFTGHRLQDIWRYFRHTWTLEYNSLPGRTLRFLIRNRARPNWPVMGIAMLASPAANLLVRDRWIGWRVDELAEGLLEGRWKAETVARALQRGIRESIELIRTDDLLGAEELAAADKSALFKLRTLVARAETARISDLRGRDRGEAAENLVDIRCLDKDSLTEDNWRQLSETSLFVRKRAEQLIPLLETLAYFRKAEFERFPAVALLEALVTKPGREAVAVALNEIKKRKLATEVADVSVCGAIAPYNHLMGGKLVGLLMTSREVRRCYAKRYGAQTSEIASQLAGRPICRSAELKSLTTTSLYGIGSSQYNRLKLRAKDVPGLDYDIAWAELESTEGFTVTHVSRSTVDYMRTLARAVYGTRRINSVFGEGSSPRTRQIREGLNLIGINNEHVLKHSLKRRVYACELFPGAREALTGFGKASPSAGPTAAALCRGWIVRWVARRTRQPEVVERLRGENAEKLVGQLVERARRAEEAVETPGEGESV
jgi:hypothetical protein